MRSLSRWQVFTLLVATAAVCAILAFRADNKVFDGIFSELFWLLLGVLLTTFALESLLSRDLEERRKREGSFGFRTMCGAALDMLMEMRKSCATTFSA